MTEEEEEEEEEEEGLFKADAVNEEDPEEEEEEEESAGDTSERARARRVYTFVIYRKVCQLRGRDLGVYWYLFSNARVCV